MKNKKVSTALYENREAAAEELVGLIPKTTFKSSDTVVIGVSEAGVFFAEHISQALKADMNILLTEPIVAPNNPELAIAMVSETEDMVMHKPLIESFGIDENYIYSEANRQYEESVLAHIYKYRKGISLPSLKSKQVVLVDECIESGLTMMVALKSMIEMGVKSVYVAVPILDQSVYENLLALCDGVFCPHQIEHYISIEYYYENPEELDFSNLENIIKRNGILSPQQ